MNVNRTFVFEKTLQGNYNERVFAKYKPESKQKIPAAALKGAFTACKMFLKI